MVWTKEAPIRTDGSCINGVYWVKFHPRAEYWSEASHIHNLVRIDEPTLIEFRDWDVRFFGEEDVCRHDQVIEWYGPLDLRAPE
jgi:hypothetical protein